MFSASWRQKQASVCISLVYNRLLFSAAETQKGIFGYCCKGSCHFRLKGFFQSGRVKQIYLFVSSLTAALMDECS